MHIQEHEHITNLLKPPPQKKRADKKQIIWNVHTLYNIVQTIQQNILFEMYMYIHCITLLQMTKQIHSLQWPIPSMSQNSMQNEACQGVVNKRTCEVVG